MISAAITIPRFLPGIPLSVDTTSHLYKILFLQYWWKQGITPFWSTDWYAGSPALLLYPPLSYYITAGLAVLGLDPLLAYKLVDALFYSLTPLAVYFLAKELGFNKGESALGALLFSLFPEVIENYIFFDRFPTVLAIPLSCIFFITFHRALAQKDSKTNILFSTLAMSALLLTHHLSALIAGLVALLMVLLASAKDGPSRPLLKLGLVAGGTLGITSFWLVPFITSFGLFSSNQFFNRNVTFPFLRFTYFGYDVSSYLLGIVQFVLAAVAVQSIIGRNFAKRIPVSPAVFFTSLLAGMAVFQAGEILTFGTIEVLGEIIVAASFVIFLGQFIIIQYARRVISRKNGVIFAVFWFILFLWLGLGYYALPVLQLPLIDTIWTKTMDVYRIWLYLALPMSALTARGILRSVSKIFARRPVLVIMFVSLAIISITVSVAMKINYDLNNTVNGVLPYSTSNAEIPPEVINYFRNDASQGRILGINVPFWIYVLPSYVNKTIIDGWYPQTILVKQLAAFNDYRLDDLETAPNQTARLSEWQKLVSYSELLDVTWIMIGDNGTLAGELMQSTNFTEQLIVPYGNINLVVYKSTTVPSFIETNSSNVNLTSVTSPNPDEIIMNFQPTPGTSTIIVKEAYFPTWVGTANGSPLVVGRDSVTGYILLTIPPDTTQVTLYQRTSGNQWSIASLTSFTVCLALTVAILIRKRKTHD